jgi:hypothetical protein
VATQYSVLRVESDVLFATLINIVGVVKSLFVSFQVIAPFELDLPSSALIAAALPV